MTFFPALLLAFSARTDPVTDWNTQALSAIRNESTTPPLAARNLAILHIAVHDAVNSVAGTHGSYLAGFIPPNQILPSAAAIGAAHRVLSDLFPSQSAAFDAALATSLYEIPNTVEKTNGLQFGRFVAEMALDARAADGSSTSVPYVPSDAPGAWRRTPPFFRPPELPQWPGVQCFALTNGSQFRPPGPPQLNSDRYSSDVNQVKALGAINSGIRTAEQTLLARFWSDFSYTVTPPGHWNQIAQNVATNNGFSLEQSARLFALLNIALADAGIAVWDAKYAYNSWRPITAIQQAELDGNPDTVADPEWTPLLNTPAFPEYVSGHSAFSAAAATVLARFCGTDNVSFTVISDSVPGVTRSYSSFAAAAEEIGLSRIYGGIHFLSADLDGLNLGHTIGDLVDRTLLLPLGAQPRLEIAALHNGACETRVAGTAGALVILESSTNLMDWVALRTNSLPFVIESSYVSPMQFFRAILPR